MTSSRHNVFRHLGDGAGNGTTTINPSELVNGDDGSNHHTGASNHHQEFYAPEQLMVNPSLNDQLSSSRDAMMKSSHEDFYYHFDNGSLFSPFDLDYYPQLIHPVDSRESQVLDTPEAMDEDDDDDDDDDDDIDSYDDVLLSSSDEEDVDLDDDKSSIPPSTTAHPMSVTPSPPPTTTPAAVEKEDDGENLRTPKVSESPEADQEGMHEPDSEFRPPQSATVASSESMDDDEEDEDGEEEDDEEDTTPRPQTTRHSRQHANRKKTAAHAHSGPHRCAMPTAEGGTCGKVFSRPYDLIRHQDTIHSPVRKTFKCDLCGDASKTFSRMDALSRHIRVKHSK
ncbi:hypothetical protein TRICI_005626 [Trichomonascus ciferrii]|uniref:C2H2-type domain-containing protein n=1 Tax=Trichomonascus ciferrii TaxID=44093 RepID=A0A642URS8_9ASCO|nr:hypothetical protein TRICI_005626 [Trichomonascus ciferrii]